MFQTTNQLYNLEETCVDLVAVSPNQGAACNVFLEPILGRLDFPLSISILSLRAYCYAFMSVTSIMPLWTSKVLIEHYSNTMLYSDSVGTNTILIYTCGHYHNLTYQGFQVLI